MENSRAPQAPVFLPPRRRVLDKLIHNRGHDALSYTAC